MIPKSKGSPGAGKVVFKLGDNVSTDAIYPGRFMATVLSSETPQYAFADYQEFNCRLRNQEIPQGSVVAAGSNFGCGSSREQAVSALKGHGLIIIARGFARIFLQNAVNLGLPLYVCPELEAEIGDELKIKSDQVLNTTTHKSYPLEPLPAARSAIIAAGGLIPYTRARLMNNSRHEN